MKKARLEFNVPDDFEKGDCQDCGYLHVSQFRSGNEMCESYTCELTWAKNSKEDCPLELITE